MLRLLQPAMHDQRIVLVGGQAVAFWQRYLQRYSSELELLEPVTSKDVDFEGSARAAQRAAELLDGRAAFPSPDHVATPNTGIVIFTDSQGVTREIDFIAEPLGLNARDVRDTAVTIEDEGEDGSPISLLVMHPQRCLESRIYNAGVLGKTGPLARRQLRVSIVCAREWSRYLLDHVTEVAETERVRAVLRLNERLFRKCATDRHFRSVLIDLNLDPFGAVLHDHPLLPEHFSGRRYPQMHAALEDRRGRDRRNRARAAARAQKRRT